MKQIVVLSTAVFLAAFAAVVMSAVEPEMAAADATIRSCTGSKITLKTIEKAMLGLHNRKRADRGLPRLCIHPKLQKSARAHSADMIRRDYFSHSTRAATKVHASVSVATATTGAFAERTSAGARAAKAHPKVGSEPG